MNEAKSRRHELSLKSNIGSAPATSVDADTVTIVDLDKLDTLEDDEDLEDNQEDQEEILTLDVENEDDVRPAPSKKSSAPIVTGGPKLTEYELKRQANIARNNELIASLGLDKVAQAIRSKSHLPQQQKPKFRKRKTPSQPTQPMEPRRRSTRINIPGATVLDDDPSHIGSSEDFTFGEPSPRPQPVARPTSSAPTGELQDTPGVDPRTLTTINAANKDTHDFDDLFSISSSHSESDVCTMRTNSSGPGQHDYHQGEQGGNSAQHNYHEGEASSEMSWGEYDGPYGARIPQWHESPTSIYESQQQPGACSTDADLHTGEPGLAQHDYHQGEHGATSPSESEDAPGAVSEPDYFVTSTAAATHQQGPQPLDIPLAPQATSHTLGSGFTSSSSALNTTRPMESIRCIFDLGDIKDPLQRKKAGWIKDAEGQLRSLLQGADCQVMTNLWLEFEQAKGYHSVSTQYIHS